MLGLTTTRRIRELEQRVHIAEMGERKWQDAALENHQCILTLSAQLAALKHPPRGADGRFVTRGEG